jgi:hypothetical protein
LQSWRDAVPFWRREEPEHERQAREAGLDLEGATSPEQPLPLEPEPRFPFVAALREAGVHGIHRQREWDFVGTALAPGAADERVVFVVLPDGTLLIEEGAGGEIEPLAELVADDLDVPHRIVAVRQEGDRWGVAANRIEVVELPVLPGHEITLTRQSGDRQLVVDGAEVDDSMPRLEELGDERYDDYVLEAERLDGDLWELRVTPL